MAKMTLKGKAKILAKATLLTVLIPFMFILMLLVEMVKAAKNEILPELMESTNLEWKIIAFNVKKVFAKEAK